MIESPFDAERLSMIMDDAKKPDTGGTREFSRRSQLEEIQSVPLDLLDCSIIGFDESNAAIRPFKIMRSMLAKRFKEMGCSVVGVTSALPNTGKSFIASNLAASISRISRGAVLLADFDLQRSSLTDYFPIDSSSGVTDFLSGEVPSVSEVARRLDGTDLILLPNYVREFSSAELLADQRFDELMRELRDLNDDVLIICDMPPLLVNDDALILSEQMDGILLVVEQNVTTKSQLEAALEMVEPTKFLGTILNRYIGPIGEDYGYSGSYEYY